MQLTHNGDLFMRVFVIDHGIVVPVAMNLLRFLDEVGSGHSPPIIGTMFASISLLVSTSPVGEIAMDWAGNSHGITTRRKHRFTIIIKIPMQFTGFFYV